MARVLITNGGSHSADNWAMATAEQIVQIDPGMAGDRLLAAEKLKLAFAEALAPHHSKVQEQERAKLRNDASYIVTSYDASEHADAALKDIVKATQGTPWLDHYSKSTVQDAVREVLISHLQASQNVERLWHADNNPDCEHVQSFRKLLQGV
jgi:bacterioferritin (cytochrome b1)